MNKNYNLSVGGLHSRSRC